MDETRQKLKEILEDVLDFDFNSEDIKFSDNLKPGDIDDWDSLSQVNILSQVEKEFQIKFTLDDIIGLTSVGSIIQMIENKTGERQL